MVLVLKVYLYIPSTGKCEVRRVAITSDYLHSYNTLCAKIITLFPELVGKTFKVYWKDEEKDDILMSTDEELCQAVANASNDMLKVYVQVTDDGPNAAAGSGCEVVHTNVVCDACNQVIKGHRYKCLQCEDFDLCTSCNALDKHLAHDMVKLVSPSSISRAWFFRGWKSMWQSMFGHEGSRDSHGHHHWRGGYHGHHGRHNFKKNKGEKCPWVEAEGNKDIVHMIGQGLSNLLSPFVESVDVYMSDGKEACSDAERSGCPAFQSPESSSSAGNEKGTSTEEVKERCAAPATTNEECIVVEKVIGDGSAAPEASKKEEPVVNVAAATGAPEPMDQDEASHPSSSKEKSPKSDASSPMGMTNPAMLLSAMSKIIAQQAGAAGAKPKGLYATLQEAAKTIDDWTIVNAPTAPEESDVSQTEPKTATSSSAQEQAKPHTEVPPTSAATQVDSSQPAIDPRYEGALNYMMSMGFNNDGNWLLQLIQAKNGNVNEVLDAMYRK